METPAMLSAVIGAILAKAVKGDSVAHDVLQEYAADYREPECMQIHVSDNDYTNDLTLYTNRK